MRFLVLSLALMQSVASGAELSDALKARRPATGEYFGLYLMNKKVGFLYTHLTVAKDNPARAVATTELHFKANVGPNVSERWVKETRTYESKPGGKLLGFSVEQKGDGGDQLLTATSTPQGIRVLRKRPNRANEILSVAASKERIEDADQARVALLRGAAVTGTVTDGTDLEQYALKTELGPAESRMFGGVKVRCRKVVTLSDKEKVPAENWVDDEGRILEINFGTNMRAIAEARETAERLDHVEVFGFTRIALPKPPPPTARAVPGKLTMLMTGLPEKFRTDTFRQKFKTLANDQVEVTLTAAPPTKTAVRPVKDPGAGVNLKSTLAVEADNPEIKSLARALVKDEPDAWVAAKKISSWVNKSLSKVYGASSDRATDVLATKRGDCTEHSLLTVALLRAAGIPAKRVDGVVYLLNDDDKVPALYWHEWVEAYVGEWTQLDPTFGQDVADATHFAVGEESGAEITPLIGQLRVLDVK